MKKILFSTILGISVTGAATASIVSRGFFEEAMENYATNTALDLKANQSDLTTLSNKIGTLPSAILPSMWTDIPYYTQEGENIPDAGIPLPPTLGEQLEFLFGGEIDSPIDRMFRVITLAGEVFPVGTLDPGSNNPQAEFLGLNPLTQKVRSIDTKIGTLRDGITVQGMFEGWTNGDSNFPGLQYFSSNEIKFTSIFGKSVGALLRDGQEEFTFKEYTGPIYPLWKLSQGIDQIGTLPSAIHPSAWTAIPYYSEHGEIMPGDGIPLPPTLGEQLTSILNSGPNSPIDRMFRVMIGAGTFYAVGNTDPGSGNPETEFLGLNPLTQKVRSIEEIVRLPSPSGRITPSRGLASLIPGPADSPYPTSIRNFMTDIYTGYWSTSALADAVYLGSEYTGQKDPALVVKGLRQITDEIGDLPNGKNLAGMISETDAKIGTLPAGYDSVGAALSAIKGIAEEAKQKAEAAIPDPKAEGATGKYVLTVDIADSSAIPVYRWEKIDRTLDETQSEQ